MKEKQNKRWGLKLLSLLCAFLVWLGVVNVADPVMTDTVEVPVEIVNAEVLEKNGLTYEIVGKKTTTVVYEVKTTNAHRIHPADFRAYADMTELWSVTGSIPVKVEVLNHGDYLVSNPVSRVSTIKIETEPLQRKRFEIGSTLNGELEDGYELGELTLSPEHLYVEGPESLIGQISSVGVEISLEGLSADAEGTTAPLYYDANGNRIELSSRIESNCDSVSYKLQILKVKNLTLDFAVSGEVADGFRFTGVECDVKNVPVIGLKSVLASLNTISIPADSLNLDGARTNVVKTIDLNDFLPVGVSLAGTGRHEINVILTVEKLEERVYTVDLEDSCYEGKDDQYIYRAEPDYVMIRIRALKEELDSLNLTARDISIDVSSMEEGRYAAEVQLNLELDQVYEVVSITAGNVIVEKEEPETEASSADGPGAESMEASSEAEDGSAAETVNAGAHESQEESTSEASEE